MIVPRHSTPIIVEGSVRKVDCHTVNYLTQQGISHKTCVGIILISAIAAAQIDRIRLVMYCSALVVGNLLDDTKCSWREVSLLYMSSYSVKKPLPYLVAQIRRQAGTSTRSSTAVQADVSASSRSMARYLDAMSKQSLYTAMPGTQYTSI
jgi:hypothetical protein